MAEVEFPAKLQCLFRPARYKVLYGGRGGAKSWGVASAIAILGAAKPLRVLCARELQRSIADSVHKLLSDRIRALGLENHYTILDKAIRGANGTEIIFAGVRNNASSIRSMEGIDIAWVEEAQLVSRSSWDILIPTIRKAASEIWLTFNPELDTDYTYQRFVANPPADSLVVKVGWQDNPWFDQTTLPAERDDLKERDPDAYLTVWEGHCRQVLDGAIYAKELRAATEQERITRVPYDATKPVHTFWDLGRADATAIWFAQSVGFEYRIVDFYENTQEPLQHYLQALQARGYVYGQHWLPHDAQAKQLGTERTIEERMRAAGFTVRIVPRMSIADGIDAARTIFATCWFDADKCSEGLNRLRRYRYDVDPNTKQFSREPLHDENSHAADAWRYLAIGLRDLKKPASVAPPKRPKLPPMTPGGWMA